MSLKAKIKFYLEKNGYMSLNELESLCKQEQKKLSNGERRLRELGKVMNITLQKNPHGAIVGYAYKVFDVERWASQWKKPEIKLPSLF